MTNKLTHATRHSQIIREIQDRTCYCDEKLSDFRGVVKSIHELRETRPLASASLRGPRPLSVTIQTRSFFERGLKDPSRRERERDWSLLNGLNECESKEALCPRSYRESRCQRSCPCVCMCLTFFLGCRLRRHAAAPRSPSRSSRD